jgi:hypothetical protein
MRRTRGSASSTIGYGGGSGARVRAQCHPVQYWLQQRNIMNRTKFRKEIKTIVITNYVSVKTTDNSIEYDTTNNKKARGLREIIDEEKNHRYEKAAHRDIP